MISDIIYILKIEIIMNTLIFYTSKVNVEKFMTNA